MIILILTPLQKGKGQTGGKGQGNHPDPHQDPPQKGKVWTRASCLGQGKSEGQGKGKSEGQGMDQANV